MAASRAVEIEVDSAEMRELVNRLKSVMTPAQFDRAMYGIFRRTGGRVKTILRKDLPQSYNIKPGEVGQAVQRAKTTRAGGAGCCIPVVGARRHIGGGGRGFTAYGHRRGWASLTSGHYDVTAVIYKGERSTLPYTMKKGYPPFRNVPSRLHGLTFTRTGKKRLSIEPVVGIAIPQMPMNRSRDDVQDDIRDYMQERMRHRFYAMLLRGK